MINDRFETAIKGVYAAGECALGVFGANRVFSAITEMLVHGLDAGENAALFASASSATDIDQKMINELEEKYLDPIRRKDGIKPSVLRREIQEKAHAHLGPIRNAVELQNFLDYLLRLKKENLPYLATDSKERTYNKEWFDAIEVQNLVHLLEASVKSALCRKESRGVHFREDYPFTDNDNWLQESVVKLKNCDLTVEHRPVKATSISLPSGVLPYFDMMKKMMESHSDTGGKH